MLIDVLGLCWSLLVIVAALSDRHAAAFGAALCSGVKGTKCSVYPWHRAIKKTLLQGVGVFKSQPLANAECGGLGAKPPKAINWHQANNKNIKYNSKLYIYIIYYPCVVCEFIGHKVWYLQVDRREKKSKKIWVKLSSYLVFIIMSTIQFWKWQKKNAVALENRGLQRLFFLKSCQKYVFVL